ncbi:unnamed protein product [Leptosia nina]|uniref:BCL2-associated athanogene 6 n=1 Tax=Leptosia nina TaxID=320188 RepID=A0AAV1K1S1_9NEOP
MFRVFIDEQCYVKDLKECFREYVDLAPVNQRLTLQGRLLVDYEKLKYYNLEGKLVHMAACFGNPPVPNENIQEGNSNNIENMPSPTLTRLRDIRLITEKIRGDLEILSALAEEPSLLARSTTPLNLGEYQISKEVADVVLEVEDLFRVYFPYMRKYADLLRRSGDHDVMSNFAEQLVCQRFVYLAGNLLHNFSHACHVISDIHLLYTNKGGSRVMSEGMPRSIPHRSRISVACSITPEIVDGQQSTDTGTCSESTNLQVSSGDMSLLIQQMMSLRTCRTSSDTSSSTDTSKVYESQPGPSHDIYFDASTSPRNYKPGKTLPCESIYVREDKGQHSSGAGRLSNAALKITKHNLNSLYAHFSMNSSAPEAVVISVHILLHQKLTPTRAGILDSYKVAELQKNLSGSLPRLIGQDNLVNSDECIDALTDALMAHHGEFIGCRLQVLSAKPEVDVLSSIRLLVRSYLSDYIGGAAGSRPVDASLVRVYRAFCELIYYCSRGLIQTFREVYRAFFMYCAQELNEILLDLLFGVAMSNMTFGVNFISQIPKTNWRPPFIVEWAITIDSSHSSTEISKPLSRRLRKYRKNKGSRTRRPNAPVNVVSSEVSDSSSSGQSREQPMFLLSSPRASTSCIALLPDLCRAPSSETHAYVSKTLQKGLYVRPALPPSTIIVTKQDPLHHVEVSA